MSPEHVNPDFDWYSAISARRKVMPRCPFASVERCPRYYQSLSLLGQAGSTSVEPDEDARLKKFWERSDLWPRTSEYASSISGGTDDRGNVRRPIFSKFCPEVAYDRFHYFAEHFGSYADEIDSELAQEQLGREGVPGSDWRWYWGSLTPLHYTECPLYSPLSHGGGFRAPSHGTGPEVTLGVPGTATMRFKSWQELHEWFSQQWRRLRCLVRWRSG